MEVAVIKGIKNVPDLAIALGYDSPEKLYRLKRKPEAKPSYDILEDLTNKFEDLNIRYLITGDGRPFISKKYDATPFDTGSFADDKVGYITSTPAAKSGSKTTIAQTPAPPTAPPTLNNSIVLTPQFITVDRNGEENILHISQRAAAGYLTGYADPVYLGKQQSFSLPGLRDGTFRSFEVDGDSMYPTLKNGQMVIGRWVEKLDYIREDRVHIVVHKTRGIIIKRLLNRLDDDKRPIVVCKSDATNDRELYKTFTIVPEDIHEIWYAVFHGGFDFQSPGDMWKRLNNNEADLVMLKDTIKQMSNALLSAGLLK